MRQLLQPGLNALALEAEPGGVLGGLARRQIDRCFVERVGSAAFLAAHEIDGPPMHEREDPRARLRAFGAEAGGRTPDAEEGLLDGVLREPVVAQHPEREPVGDPADTVVQLGQRGLVTAGDECDEGLVGKVGEVPAH